MYCYNSIRNNPHRFGGKHQAIYINPLQGKSNFAGVGRTKTSSANTCEDRKTHEENAKLKERKKHEI